MSRVADSFPNPLLILIADESGVTGSASRLRNRIGNLEPTSVTVLNQSSMLHTLFS